jgi:branched-subunit amino acid transport protein
MNALLTQLPLLVAMALCVYLPKAIPLAAVSLGAGSRSAKLRAWLEYVSPAVLSALVAAEIVAPGGAITPPRLEHLSYVAVIAIGLATRRAWLALIAGLALYLGLR